VRAPQPPKCVAGNSPPPPPHLSPGQLTPNRDFGHEIACPQSPKGVHSPQKGVRSPQRVSAPPTRSTTDRGLLPETGTSDRECHVRSPHTVTAPRRARTTTTQVRRRQLPASPATPLTRPAHPKPELRTRNSMSTVAKGCPQPPKGCPQPSKGVRTTHPLHNRPRALTGNRDLGQEMPCPQPPHGDRTTARAPQTTPSVPRQLPAPRHTSHPASSPQIGTSDTESGLRTRNSMSTVPKGCPQSPKGVRSPQKVSTPPTRSTTDRGSCREPGSRTGNVVSVVFGWCPDLGDQHGLPSARPPVLAPG
jgi:hypothetical protein